MDEDAPGAPHKTQHLANAQHPAGHSYPLFLVLINQWQEI